MPQQTAEKKTAASGSRSGHTRWPVRGQTLWEGAGRPRVEASTRAGSPSAASVGFRPHQPCLGGSEQKAARLQPFCYPEAAGEEGERGPQDRKGKLLAAPGAKPSCPRGSRKAGTGGSSPGLSSFSSRGISLVWLPATSNLEPMESGNQKHHRWASPSSRGLHWPRPELTRNKTTAGPEGRGQASGGGRQSGA